jgi:hypothetical protein
MQKVVKAIARDLAGSLRDLGPVVITIAVFQGLVLRQPISGLATLIGGLALVVAGLTAFVYGLNLALFPVGESLAHSLARKGSLAWLLCFAFLLGFGTTVAEPALTAVAAEAASVAAQAGFIATSEPAKADYAFALRLTVALSVGVAIVAGTFRIVIGWSLPGMIAAGYLLVVVLTYFAPPEIIGIAYDSGGVTTSTVTVPLVTALGIGLATAIRGRNPVTDGFGLIAFASLSPIAFVLVFGMVTAWA